MSDYEQESDFIMMANTLPNFIPKEAQSVNTKNIIEPEKVSEITGQYMGFQIEDNNFFVSLLSEDSRAIKFSVADLGWDVSGDRLEECKKIFASNSNLVGSVITLKRDHEFVISDNAIQKNTTVSSDPANKEIGAQKTVKNSNLDSSKFGADQTIMKTLLNTANAVTADSPVVNPSSLQDVNASLNRSNLHHQAMQEFDDANRSPMRQPPQQAMQPKTGGQSLADGASSFVSGAAALLGGAAKVVGDGMGDLSGLLKKPNNLTKEQLLNSANANIETSASSGVTILPRLSDYRVDQVERAANAYEQAHQQFWQCEKLANVRHEIEERARVTGISVEDVMEKMKPNGEMADLYKSFNDAVKESPDAITYKQAMEKALDGWGRQHGRASEELLNPEQEGSSLHEKLKGRIETAAEKMNKNASNLPTFDGDEKAHIERIREIMAKIAEKLKNFLHGAINFLSGRKAEKDEVENAPSP